MMFVGICSTGTRVLESRALVVVEEGEREEGRFVGFPEDMMQ
jgi:hypothetical protein